METPDYRVHTELEAAVLYAGLKHYRELWHWLLWCLETTQKLFSAFQNVRVLAYGV